MNIIFGTTNKRKVEDLNNIILQNNLDINVLTLNDIGWDLGETEETGESLEENSLIKAKAIYDFCLKRNISYPILTDDAGLFVESLNGEPGIYTGRYGDDELALDPSLPKYQCLYKLLRKLENEYNRAAYYKCVITYMLPNGVYFQESSITNGSIDNKINEPIKKPYFYSLFLVNDRPFNSLEPEELKDTYRYKALEKTIKRIK